MDLPGVLYPRCRLREKWLTSFAFPQMAHCRNRRSCPCSASRSTCSGCPKIDGPARHCRQAPWDRCRRSFRCSARGVAYRTHARTIGPWILPPFSAPDATQGGNSTQRSKHEKPDCHLSDRLSHRTFFGLQQLILGRGCGRQQCVIEVGWCERVDGKLLRRLWRELLHDRCQQLGRFE